MLENLARNLNLTVQKTLSGAALTAVILLTACNSERVASKDSVNQVSTPSKTDSAASKDVSSDLKSPRGSGVKQGSSTSKGEDASESADNDSKSSQKEEIPESSAEASDLDPLLKAVEETASVIVDLKNIIQSSTVGAGLVNQTELGDSQSSRALKILSEVNGSLIEARVYLNKYMRGEEKNFNFNFGCSYTGDASIELASADLELGFPQNSKPEWRTKMDSSIDRLQSARKLVNCP